MELFRALLIFTGNTSFFMSIARFIYKTQISKLQINGNCQEMCKTGTRTGQCSKQGKAKWLPAAQETWHGNQFAFLELQAVLHFLGSKEAVLSKFTLQTEWSSTIISGQTALRFLVQKFWRLKYQPETSQKHNINPKTLSTKQRLFSFPFSFKSNFPLPRWFAWCVYQARQRQLSGNLVQFLPR